ncbi:hypothetical protein [Microbacterium lacticum]
MILLTLLTLISAIAIAIAATFRTVHVDGYRRTPTDRTRLP